MEAVDNHKKWVEAAKFLGCHSIRVNAASRGKYDDQVYRAADGLRALTEFAAEHDINVIVENHGGLSSNADWLAEVISAVDHPRWSQASERVIGSGLFAKRQPTLMFNGYADEVAGLYAGLDLRRNF